jgi:hypothetical protein
MCLDLLFAGEIEGIFINVFWKDFLKKINKQIFILVLKICMMLQKYKRVMLLFTLIYCTHFILIDMR